jgi:hypothetical protein
MWSGWRASCAVWWEGDKLLERFSCYFGPSIPTSLTADGQCFPLSTALNQCRNERQPSSFLNQFTHVTKPIHTYYQTNSHMLPNQFTRITKPIHTCYQTNSHVLPNQFTCVTKPIHMCYQTNSHVLPNQFTRVTKHVLLTAPFTRVPTFSSRHHVIYTEIRKVLFDW